MSPSKRFLQDSVDRYSNSFERAEQNDSENEPETEEDPFTEEQPKRTRGAQPGNINNLKHGFYSKRFTKAEKANLQATTVDDLTDEINLLRVLNLRLFTQASKSKDLHHLAHLLEITGRTSTRIASLCRIHALTSPNANDQMRELLNAALDELSKEPGFEGINPV